jgi:hypothetical protein
MNTSIKAQAIDQGSKSVIASIISYVLVKYGMDAGLVILVMPVIVLVLAWISSKIGDPTIASFFSGSAPVEPTTEVPQS